MTAGPARAQSSSSFEAFIASTAAAHATSGADIDKQSYILDLYRGVKVDKTYVEDGNYFDCVRTETQPSLRGRAPATPPEATTMGKGTDDVPAGVVGASQVVHCAAGTIPMQRVTLERMAKFATVKDYLAKKPGGAATQAAHRYAYGAQNVTNYGGNSWINLWNPSGEFTLTQHWYTAYPTQGTQSVEGGWVHYPGKFGNNAVLFIFYTPDSYAHGCYNLECSGFVQTNTNWSLGGAWSSYSTYGGTQYGFQQQWKYYAGNWWLWLRGSGANLEPVGYYPGTLYGAGTMSSNATWSKFGGETCCASPWPQMGSGKLPSTGFGQAAYQNTIFYISSSASGGTGVWSSLTTSETHPACYKIAYTPASSGGSWGTYFYYGGPGGSC
ncbi:hypothetical protein F4553_000205 [Allocatelliglobosispora scoriae]|uniref:Neprosin PEP catalytic domain-containing protein n=2 Tax=Allocatelliglobosispora scoriae TaxID=643052 RepID=A0A841BI22_9ACTN|nr:hypothetical protein [Allocatelliglobosispora scoriae]